VDVVKRGRGLLAKDLRPDLTAAGAVERVAGEGIPEALREGLVFEHLVVDFDLTIVLPLVEEGEE